ncbi:MAG: type II toxin-antitoxin system RelE/ParE family toxin [Tabrizicola sp.]|uniref:type II toxin-antitoxin system RelE/ParE family toxin n=1 Tax=Tabrizicola sp. TaxID=2005166 RepID=UPI002ABC66D4|nr:type II toxin-antitoxin system RelE/ParE family toxin [Tabrizicola sp.]MDZ4085779.1 type II toxin-antitoxin system RelE/ParE family toxin [Tabrizicola sp.]
MKLTFSPSAVADIGAIWDYTAEIWGMDQADRYVDDIRSACLALADGERAGRRVDVRDGYLKYPVGRHLIFFRQDRPGIVVIRVLHQSMDVERHL